MHVSRASRVAWLARWAGMRRDAAGRGRGEANDASAAVSGVCETMGSGMLPGFAAGLRRYGVRGFGSSVGGEVQGGN